MKIIINGKEELVENDSLNLAELLKIKKVEMPEMVSVQLNGVFIKKENYQNTEVQEKDEVNFLYFMGGGAKN